MPFRRTGGNESRAPPHKPIRDAQHHLAKFRTRKHSRHDIRQETEATDASQKLSVDSPANEQL
jgi:hypothetical protein